MEIRLATEADVPRLVELGRRMHDESPRYAALPFDAEQVECLARQIIDSPQGIAIVAELDGTVVGMMVGLVAHYFFCAERYATDVAVYVEPEHRGTSAAPRLLKAWAATLADMGVSESVLGISTEVNPERTRDLYQRFGYRESGAIMVRQISRS